jgi:hypothetical protein
MAKSERIAQKFEDVAAKGETVEQAAGETFIAQYLYPITEGQVGGDDERNPLMQGGTELEEQLGADGREGHITKLVEDDKLVAQGFSEKVWELMRGLGIL